MITSPHIVDNARATGSGPWSFGELLRRIAPPNADMNVYARNWLSQWEQTRLGSIHPVRQRSSEMLLHWWEMASGGVGKPLDMAKAPFRLLAIVNRMDLRHFDEPGGEGRFVYTAFDPLDGKHIPFTVIFEFGLNDADRIVSPSTPILWSKRFQQLSCLDIGSSEFLERLQNLTDRFTSPYRIDGRGIGETNVSFRSRLRQLRTNDFVFDTEWELREFRLSGRGALVGTRTAQTPDIRFQTERQSELVSWIQQNKVLIESGEARLPLRFLGSSAPVPHESFLWLKDQPALPLQLKTQFSQLTCNGCHGGSSRTIFTHINPRDIGQESRLSPWLREDLRRREGLFRSLVEQGSRELTPEALGLLTPHSRVH
jgi:hypothetical protein